jgi:hypothetical protein
LPNGKWIAFDHHETRGQIYLIDSEGRNMHMVAAGDYEMLCQRGRATGRPFISRPTAPKLAGVEAGTRDQTRSPGDPARRLYSV